MSRTFKCAHCGGTFGEGWSEEEATAEAKAAFGKSLNIETCAVVCDDCYKLMLPANHPHLVEEVMAEELRRKP